MECNRPCVLHASGLPEIFFIVLRLCMGMTTRWMRLIGKQYVYGVQQPLRVACLRLA